MQRYIAAALMTALSWPVLAQNPNTPKFPSAIATDQDLLVARNASSSVLSAAITATDTQIPVADGSVFSAYELVTIDQERILICSVSGNVLTVCPGGRGFDSSSAASHASGARVSGVIAAWYHNQLAAEIKAIQTALGINLSNVGDITGVGSCSSGNCFQSVSAGTVFAGPAASTGQATFRQLVESDIPAEIARDSEIPVTSVFGRTGAVTSQPGDYSASQVTNAPAGDISATNVQAAINELDTEKAPVGHTHSISGDVSGTLSAASVQKIQGRNVSSSAPSSGQVLKWDSVNSQWTPSPDSGPVTSVFGRTGAVTKQAGDYAFSDISGTAAKSQLPSSTVFSDQSNAWTTGSQDFSSAGSTKPMRLVSSLPSSCTVGEYVMLSTASAGQNTYACTSVNTWSLQGGGIPDAYKFVTDGSSSATASGADTLKIRSSDGSINVAVANNDPTHGDNINLTLNKSAHQQTFTSSTQWVSTGTDHGLGTCDLVAAIWVDDGTGLVQTTEGFSSIKCNPAAGASQYNVTVNWPVATAGRLVLIKSGGAGAGGGGGGGGSCTGGCVGGGSSLDESGKLPYIASLGILTKAAGIFTDGSRLCLGCTSWSSSDHSMELIKASGNQAFRMATSLGSIFADLSYGTQTTDAATIRFGKTGGSYTWMVSANDTTFNVLRQDAQQVNMLRMKSTGETGIGRNADPTATLHVSDAKPSSLSSVTFTGTGTNDMLAGGTYNGNSTQTYCVQIDGEGTPNTFRWGRDPACSAWQQSNVAIPDGGAPYSLDYGVEISFESTTGHVTADRWTFQAFPGGTTSLFITAGIAQQASPLAMFESQDGTDLSGVSSSGEMFQVCQATASHCSVLSSQGLQLAQTKLLSWSPTNSAYDLADSSIGRYAPGGILFSGTSGQPYFYFDGPGMAIRAGLTASFPALKRSGSLWEARLGDDSALTAVKGAVPSGPDQYIPYGGTGQPVNGCAQFVNGKIVSTGASCGSSPSGAPNKSFTSSSTWTFNASEHGITNCNVVWAAYTVSGTVHTWTEQMSSYTCDGGNITVTWPAPVSGKLVVSGGGGGGSAVSNMEKQFTNATSVSILGSEHGFGHRRLMVRCYDSSGYRIEPDSEQVNPTTFDVNVTFASPRSGWCVVNGG